jgi:hypothetical protein
VKEKIILKKRKWKKNWKSKNEEHVEGETSQVEYIHVVKKKVEYGHVKTRGTR